MYLKSSDCDGRRKLEAFVWEKQLLPPSHACMVFHKILVNSKIFKLSLYLSLTHLRAQIACYELKGDLSAVMLKEIFDESFENFEFTRAQTRSTTDLPTRRFPRRCHTIRILFDRWIDVYGRAWKQVTSQSFWNGGKVRRGEHIIDHRLL